MTIKDPAWQKSVDMLLKEQPWWSKSTEITDDMVAKMRESIGRGGQARNQWVENVTRDTLFHAAVGFGDDNPLWIDADYARKTKWGTRLAPPCFLTALAYGTRFPLDRPGIPKPSPGTLSGMPGIGGYALGTEHTWFGPIREGDHLQRWGRSLAVLDLNGPQAGDRIEAEMDVESGMKAWKSYMGNWTTRSVVQVGETLNYREPAHELATRTVGWMARMPRGIPVEEGPYGNVTMPEYSPKDLEMIWDEYGKDSRRGAAPLYYEDVTIGDELPKRLRGPLTFTSMRALAAAGGSNFAMGDGLYMKYLRRSPGANRPHPGTNVPDVPNRIHWDTDMARTIGLPRGYDINWQRVWWFASLVTDWIGDSAYLRYLSCWHPSPLFLWELFWMTGHVVGKRKTEAGPAIEIELRGDNERGEMAFGRAVAIVESRS